MSSEFEKLMLQEFNKVNKRLDNIELEIKDIRKDVNGLKKDVAELKVDVAGLKEDVAELKIDVAGLKKDVAELKIDVAGLKKDVAELKIDVAGLKKDVAELKIDVAGLKTKVYDDIEPTLIQNSQKLDIMTNNIVLILNDNTRYHKEILKKFEKYENKNELEHSRLNYEICKLKANA
jgi:chromosome segregation ATPase